jgi:tRNA(adenine34) deaminase
MYQYQPLLHLIDFMDNRRYTKTMEDEYFMKICLDEAMAAFMSNEVPVGAVIVSPDNQVVAKAHNLTIHRNSPLAHAETIVMDMAAKVLGNFRLTGCTLFVSKEPCVMCAGTIIEARIKRVVFGCYDAKRGALGSLIDVNKLPLNHKFDVRGGLLEEKSKKLLKDFFQIRRGTEVAITGPTRNRLYAL